MKVGIRFLCPGFVVADTPNNFRGMSPIKQLEWATDYLASLSGEGIIQAMSDFYEEDNSGFLVSNPSAEAIETNKKSGEDPDVIVQTKAWNAFAYALDSRDIVED